MGAGGDAEGRHAAGASCLDVEGGVTDHGEVFAGDAHFLDRGGCELRLWLAVGGVFGAENEVEAFGEAFVFEDGAGVGSGLVCEDGGLQSCRVAVVEQFFRSVENLYALEVDFLEAAAPNLLAGFDVLGGQEFLDGDGHGSTDAALYFFCGGLGEAELPAGALKAASDGLDVVDEGAVHIDENAADIVR